MVWTALTFESLVQKHDNSVDLAILESPLKAFVIRLDTLNEMANLCWVGILRFTESRRQSWLMDEVRSVSPLKRLHRHVRYVAIGQVTHEGGPCLRISHYC